MTKTAVSTLSQLLGMTETDIATVRNERDCVWSGSHDRDGVYGLGEMTETVKHDRDCVGTVVR